MSGEFTIVFALYPRVTQLDFTGPYEILIRLPGARAVLASSRGGEIEADGGMTFARVARLADDGRLLLVLWDVTDRERLARRVADLQSENENIIQNMNSALLVVDLEGRITFANATAERILGASLRGREVWVRFQNFTPNTAEKKAV